MNQWNDLCLTIDICRKQNISESYLQKFVENVFEKLGWLQHDEILAQKQIPLGVGHAVPDITISRDGKHIFVVELKKPNDVLSTKDTKQLISYMSLLKLSFGLLIGNTFQVYYDVPDDKNDPVKIIEIEFNKDDKDGVEFFGLITKKDYSNELLTLYCQEKLEEILTNKEIDELTTFLYSNEGLKYINEALRNHLSSRYKNNIIDAAIDKIKIEIKSKLKLPIDPDPDPVNKAGNPPEPPVPTTFRELKTDVHGNKYYTYPNDDDTFKHEAFDDKCILVKVKHNDGHIEIIKRKVTKIWESSVYWNINSMPSSYAKIDHLSHLKNLRVYACPQRWEALLNSC